MFAVKWFKVLANQKQGFPMAAMFLPDREHFVKYLTNINPAILFASVFPESSDVMTKMLIFTTTDAMWWHNMEHNALLYLQNYVGELGWNDSRYFDC